jgi:YQGE family putative transporter
MLVKCKSYGKKLDMKKALKSNCAEWSIIRKTTTLWGFRDVIIIFVVNILIIETTKSELSVGKFALIGALVSSASYILVQKIIKPPHRRLSIIIGATGSFMAVLGLIFKINYTMLFFYVILDGFFLPFFLIQLASSTFNVIDKEHENDMRIEYMINKDIAINGGRIISSIILLILLYLTKDLSILKVYLIFIGVIPIIAAYFLRKLKALNGSYNQVRKSN